ncbi:PqiC family protein [Pseudomonas fluorescens]|uniref:Membrane integrity-associated transporter subunit PqiC n=1 Tax=Pseudomonas fluorescens TaxID=294 RepID=A0A944DSB6_PSEFL|nr:PqiC family protein [Pseudomonas fluorescens]MBT2298338.1 membrane integrity-associated transporter subunit PqiC [Pseudomonas fluorescens]MBT2309538.1 membrane integrity-associated transporter subunit PqiC [Pseudomonas fluorescens]MBT2314702.1 membrane integrity-associated transporter subunit PqiC [Pseudomonas fluorescens]MBT2331890.1 membrane integrity-associated transporter subunit PqiC [Pseudomonas fluorescens]MBT2345355.1 membrane integrity-associated transporter subunit PqiC [Pseudomon
MPPMLKLTLVALALLLAACRGDPIQYHTLSPAQPAGQPRTNMDIQLEQVSVPPQVDRAQMVIRQGNSGLAILETQWWGASLADELHSSLDEQLSNPGAPKLLLRVEVQRFDSIPGQYARMDVQWRLRDLGNEARTLTCRNSLQTPAGSSIDELVTAHQQNVRQFVGLVEQAATRNACP